MSLPMILENTANLFKQTSRGASRRYGKANPPDRIMLNDSMILKGEAWRARSLWPSDSGPWAVTSSSPRGLRDYHSKDQVRAERTRPRFLNRLVSIFNEVKQVLRDDAALFNESKTGNESIAR